MIPNNSIENKIDTNNDKFLQKSEVLDFLKDSKNVVELGNNLSQGLNNFFKSNPVLVNIINDTLNQDTIQNPLKDKITKNQILDEKDICILYIQSLVDPFVRTIKPIYNPSGKDFYTKFGGQNLLSYIRIKYNNPKYEFTFFKRIEQQTHTQPNIGRILSNESRETSNIELPRLNDLSVNFYSTREFDTLYKWAESNFNKEFKSARESSAKRNNQKKDNKEDYIKYDLYIFALQKYQQIIEKQYNIITNKIYGNSETCEKQMNLASSYFEGLNKKTELEFSDIEDICKKLESFNKDLESIKKKYLGKLNEEQANKTYQEYLKEVDSIGNDFGVDKISEILSKEPSNEQEAMDFFNSLNRLEEFKQKEEDAKSKYGKIIDNYENYINNKKILVNKYGSKNLENWYNKYSKYNNVINQYNKEHSAFDLKKYKEYSKSIEEANLGRLFGNVSKLSGCLDYNSSDFPVRTIKQNYEEQLNKQEQIDKWWAKLKSKNIMLYQLCNIGSRGINALISSTWGTGAKLGLVVSKLWSDDDEMVALSEKANRRSSFGFNISTQQSKSVYENGKITFNWDNGPGVIAESIVNMCTLIAGGGAIAKGAIKGATLTGINVGTKGLNIAGKVGLFGSGFIQQVGPSFQEGLNAGMRGNEALLYSCLNAGIQGGLELVSPNEFLLGKGSGVAKQYIQELLKSGSKNSFKAVGKLFLKNVGSEIIEENIQETLQLCAGNLVNMWANNQFDLGISDGTETLDNDWNFKNFAATVLVTTLTTGIVTGGSTIIQGNSISSTEKSQLIQEIKTNPELYGDVMKTLNNAIDGKIKIPGIKIESLKGLQEELISNEILNNNYFDGKSHKFDVTESQARSNSQIMDNILAEINEENKSQKIEELRQEINEQYKQATGEELNLTDEQLLSILDAHEQDGILGELTIGQLKQKVKVLSESISDSNVRRFLLEAGFCGKLEISEKVKAQSEKQLSKFLESNSDIKTKIDEGKFEFMGKSIEELYKRGLSFILEGKSESQYESLILDFNTRFLNSLEFVSDQPNAVKFLDSKTGKLIEGTITDYGKNLLGEDLGESPTKKAFFDKLKSSMFYQHLDNPLKYCSHGADHSILVDRYVQNIIESYPDVVNKVQEKYGVNKEGAIQLLRLTAVFHDFGYPDIGGLAKSMHGPFGGAHFINGYASTGNSTFIDFIEQNLGIIDEVKRDQLIKDMKDAIFFHSADKVEKGYLNRITYTKGSFLIGNDLSAKGTDDFIDILTRDSDGVMTITYRQGSEEGKINAENFKSKLLEKYPNLDGEKILIEEDIKKSYSYDEEFGSTTEYQGRKGKVGDTGIEFQPIDLLKDPLAGIVRLADNMDMSFDRLTKIQSHPIFMNLFYNIGYNHESINGHPTEQTTSYIYQQMEKLNKLDKKKQVSKEEYDSKSEKDKKDYITPEEYKEQYNEISTKIKALIEQANQNGGLEMTIFDEKTGRPKEGNSTFRIPFDKSILKVDGKVDLYTYKQFIIEEMAKHEGITSDSDVQIIQNIAIDDDISAYSFRHFIGLTPIKDVTIENNSETKRKTLVVKVNKDIYFEPSLRNQKISEGSFDNRPVVEYHIWRLFDASGRVTVDNGLLELKIIDETTNEILGTASRENATEKLNIHYNIQTPDAPITSRVAD